MRSTQQLHELGQSLWLDNITRELLTGGTLRRYRDEFSVTGLTSNPTIFDLAIRNGTAYDESIRNKTAQGKSGEELFFELALEDLTQAADLFRPIYEATNGVDGWVSVEVSPLLAYDTANTVKQVAQLHAQAKRPNLFVKIPGTPQGVPAIEEATFQGVPVNVTLLFSRAQYLASAEAYMRGIERRIVAGLNPKVHSVASLFISRWDKAVMGKAPENLRIAWASRSRSVRINRIAICMSRRGGRSSPRPEHRASGCCGAAPARKIPARADVIYIEALAAPDTINTMPEKTLLAFADHGHVKDPLPRDGADAEKVLAQFASAGVDDSALAEQLQQEGAQSFDKSWNDLMSCLSSKSKELKRAS